MKSCNNTCKDDTPVVFAIGEKLFRKNGIVADKKQVLIKLEEI